MILSNKRRVSIADVFCDEAVPRDSADVVRYNQWSTPISGIAWPPFHTIVIDLGRSEEDLLAAIDKGTRYEIRRAQRDTLVYSIADPVTEALPAFRAFYNRFAPGKGLPEIDSAWLDAAARSGNMMLSRVSRGDEVLVWHAYVRCGSTAVLLHSCSEEAAEPAARQIVGRANRYQHWEDIVYFRRQGLGRLDLGGWYGGAEDRKLLAINKFKEEFGGTVIPVHNGMAGVSWKGKLAVGYLRARAALRGPRQAA